ncbi:hypothetical protein [Bacillus chungangensis]|uniref:Flagellar hook-length control protein FliK n=1 Tax=Bacillus chungangensis TaxID=587633 RepID=A0ABT9WRB7_9BACI|nr:hypothetical protein [Bacillus chungangensis]MDQ0175839.1 hypothetical protein [Bacillus chungangensis]
MISSTIDALNQIQGRDNLQTMTFRNGQIFYGTIKKLFPNQTALVQVGQQQVIAKIEVPLKTGEGYWLQVASEDGDIQLKLLNTPLHGESKAAALLRQFSLPLQKEYLQLVEFFVKEQLPLSKEAIMKAMQWLQKLPQSESGLNTLKGMLQKGIPLSEVHFLSLLETEKPQTTQQLLQALQEALRGENMQSRTVVSLLSLLDSLTTKGDRIGERMLFSLLTHVLKGENTPLAPLSQQILAKIGILNTQQMQQLDGNVPANQNRILQQDITQVINQLVRQVMTAKMNIETVQYNNAGNVPLTGEQSAASSQESVYQQLRGAGQLPESVIHMQQQIVKGQSLLEIMQSGQQKSLTNRTILQWLTASLSHLQLDHDAIGDGRQLSQSLEKVRNVLQLSQEQMSHAVRRMANFNQEQLFSQNEKTILQMLEGEQRQTFPRQDALLQFKQMMSSIGLFYEGEIMSSSGPEKIMESVKPLLVQLLQETPQSTTRDIAEQLLLRMNGFQLQSIANGPIQQIIYELPINLFGHQTDLTMQWAGKRLENGKIDPNFCRIIFYLELENLRETIVDMQVQNRVVTVNIFNETEEMHQLSQSFLPSLKAGLKELQYTLSAVHFKLPEEKTMTQETGFKHYEYANYSGVDIRI